MGKLSLGTTELKKLSFGEINAKKVSFGTTEIWTDESRLPMSMELSVAMDVPSGSYEKITGMVAQSAYPLTVISNDELVVPGSGLYLVSGGAEYDNAYQTQTSRAVDNLGNVLIEDPSGSSPSTFSGQISLIAGRTIRLEGNGSFYTQVMAGAGTFLRIEPVL